MLRWYTLAACLYLLCNAAFAHADTVTLRPRIEASGQAVLLGDVFDGAGAAGARAIAPAPPAGQTSQISVRVLAAAVSSAGLDWSPPAGVTSVPVMRAAGMRASLPAAADARTARADAVVRRGEAVTLSYQIPGLRLAASARALEDGAVGDSVRLVNLSSNRTISATVTGPGAASAP